MPLRLSLASLRNVIAVVFLQYIISSWRVGAITDTRQGSFCFNLLIPKSGFFFICCGVHKSKFDWQGVCIFFFSSPLSLSLSLCHVNCYCLLPQIAWEVCQMNGSTAAPFLADLYTTKHAGWPAIIQTNAPRPPARARLRLPAYKLDRCMLTVSAIVPSFFVRACLILSLPPSIFFIFTLFNKAEHLASGCHMDGQLCRWSRWKSTPGHVKEWDFQS